MEQLVELGFLISNFRIWSKAGRSRCSSSSSFGESLSVTRQCIFAHITNSTFGYT